MICCKNKINNQSLSESMQPKLNDSPLKNNRILPYPSNHIKSFQPMHLTNSFQTISKSPSANSNPNLNVLSAKIQGIEKRLKDQECKSPTMRFSNTSAKGAAELLAKHKNKSQSGVFPAEQMRSSWDNHIQPIFLRGYEPNQENKQELRMSLDFNLEDSSKNKLNEFVRQKKNEKNNEARTILTAAEKRNRKNQQNINKTGEVYGSQQAKNTYSNYYIDNRLEQRNASDRTDKIKNRIKRSMEVLEYLKNQENTNKNKDKMTKKPFLMTEGQIVNGFRLCHKLGKGKFGQVYLALHLNTGFVVAIKKIAKSKLLEYNLVEQFIKELKIHSSLDNPKIVKFFGFFYQKQHFYLILEYMNGGTLFDYLNIVKKLKPKQAAEYLKDIIEAVTQMHDKSIAHRDIKPQNIVINTEGVAKLCDFGWAAVIDKSRTTYCGTLEYVSPQILDRKSYDESVDIWSLGILTYQMVMGRAPFQNKDRSVVKEKIRNTDLSQIQYSEEVPGEVRQFIECLIQKEPSRRPKIRELLSHPMLIKYGSAKSSKKLPS